MELMGLDWLHLPGISGTMLPHIAVLLLLGLLVMLVLLVLMAQPASAVSSPSCCSSQPVVCQLWQCSPLLALWQLHPCCLGIIPAQCCTRVGWPVMHDRTVGVPGLRLCTVFGPGAAQVCPSPAYQPNVKSPEVNTTYL